MNRVLTIQIEITNKEMANWIWSTHMNGSSQHGVHVQGIYEGPMPKDGADNENDDDSD